VISSPRKSREKVLAAVTISVVLGAVIFTVVIEPQLKKRKACLMQMGQLQLKLAKMKGDLLIKDRIDSIYSQIEPFIVDSGTDQQEISLFTRDLSDLYSRLNVKTRTIKILPVASEEFYRRLSVRIEMSGPIREILNFTASLETHSNPVKIEQLDVKAQEIADNIEASFVVTKVVARQQT
jgi:Tfp pilus assembly protein PilO